MLVSRLEIIIIIVWKWSRNVRPVERNTICVTSWYTVAMMIEDAFAVIMVDRE